MPVEVVISMRSIKLAVSRLTVSSPFVAIVPWCVGLHITMLFVLPHRPMPPAVRESKESAPLPPLNTLDIRLNAARLNRPGLRTSTRVRRDRPSVVLPVESTVQLVPFFVAVAEYVPSPLVPTRQSRTPTIGQGVHEHTAGTEVGPLGLDCTRLTIWLSPSSETCSARSNDTSNRPWRCPLETLEATSARAMVIIRMANRASTILPFSPPSIRR